MPRALPCRIRSRASRFRSMHRFPLSLRPSWRGSMKLKKATMERSYDLIVFDWDGTLMDSTALIVRAIQAASADLGLRVPTREQASYVIGMGLAEALHAAVPELDPADYPRLVERYRIHYLSGDQDLVLFDGVETLLRDLRAQGRTLAVATGKSRAGLDRALGA